VIRAHTVEAVRRAEAAAMARVPEGALMQRAAAALAATVTELLRRHRGGVAGRRVVLLVGPGSNGGDALWAGARLAGRGVRVDAVLVADHGHPEGLAALRAAGGRVCGAGDGDTVLRRGDVVVDGILGIGGRPGLDATTAALLTAVPPEAAVVAVDLPSGVDPDTGETPGAHVRADVTVSFGTAKGCLLLPPAAAAAGTVRVVDIGLDPAELGAAAVERVEPADVAARWPVPGPDDDKYSRGVVGVVAGGATYTGAAVLCTGAAVRTGAGMVRYVGPTPPTDLVRARWPEVVPGQGRVQAWVAGPGIDPEDAEQRPAVEAALRSGLPAVLDAGALAVLDDGPRDVPTLLTPHAGELARLLQARGEDVARDDVERRPLHWARRAAQLTGATVLLKGATTLVVAPDGRVRAQPDGPHWLATAGSGDVLAGIAGALLAAGLEPVEAGSLATLVHGTAGHVASGGGPVSAGSVLDAVPTAVARLLRAGRGALGD
jgi:hydroxyethylthiazole kinase-like uncharacterized protein yjeF